MPSNNIRYYRIFSYNVYIMFLGHIHRVFLVIYKYLGQMSLYPILTSWNLGSWKLLETNEDFEILWMSLAFGGPGIVGNGFWLPCWTDRMTRQYLDAASDTVVGETIPWLMGDVIMPDSSGREFYTVWFHIDKVSFTCDTKLHRVILLWLALIFF